MSLPTPAFFCSFKTYPGTAGCEGLTLARSLAQVAPSTGPNPDPDESGPVSDTQPITIAIAPQTPDIRHVSRAIDCPVIAQAADAAAPGGGTGDVLVETLAAAGADALFVNHPEREQSIATTRTLISDCADSGMDAIVCVRSIAEGRAAVELGADWILFEQPADIASGEPIVQRDPGRVRSFVDRVRSAATKYDRHVSIAVGGGISTSEDVEAAFDAGVDAVGAASHIVTAADPAAQLETLLGDS